MKIPDWMIVYSFRYCLGRMTYAVSDFVEWAIENWDNIPSKEQFLIAKELNEAFNSGNPRALGMDMDKQQWQLLRDHIQGI